VEVRPEDTCTRFGQRSRRPPMGSGRHHFAQLHWIDQRRRVGGRLHGDVALVEASGRPGIGAPVRWRPAWAPPRPDLDVGKPLRCKGFPGVAGAGFEPATFGL